jgi:hypothetical protein
LGALENLKRLWLGGGYSRSEIEKLRADLPRCTTFDVDIDESPEPRPEPKRRGLVAYNRDEGGETWSIFQNLEAEFDKSNYTVEKLVKAAVRKRAPALARQLLFDSEGDNFCVVAKSERDILKVADVITDLAKGAGE